MRDWPGELGCGSPSQAGIRYVWAWRHRVIETSRAKQPCFGYGSRCGKEWCIGIPSREQVLIMQSSYTLGSTTTGLRSRRR